MAKRKIARVTQNILKKDQLIVKAVLTLKDYSPANSEFTVARLREALRKIEEVTAAERRALDAVANAREEAMRIELQFHELAIGAKRQVIAQYGDESDEITSLGMKKKSERKVGRPRKATKAQGGT
ncbi:MAG: hypothetical protein HYX66_06915 [Ignavibacteria bacterium]|nr:hypothetical protein [Ignavibacteria bacterium]